MTCAWSRECWASRRRSPRHRNCAGRDGLPPGEGQDMAGPISWLSTPLTVSSSAPTNCAMTGTRSLRPAPGVSPHAAHAPNWYARELLRLPPLRVSWSAHTDRLSRRTSTGRIGRHRTSNGAAHHNPANLCGHSTRYASSHAEGSRGTCDGSAGPRECRSVRAPIPTVRATNSDCPSTSPREHAPACQNSSPAALGGVAAVGFRGQ